LNISRFRQDFDAPGSLASRDRVLISGRERQGEIDMDKAREALEELLNDPIVRLVMASDGVKAEEVRSLFAAGQDESDEEETELPALHVIASSPCGQGMCCV
jgi:hypothetical protein